MLLKYIEHFEGNEYFDKTTLTTSHFLLKIARRR